MDRPLTAEVLLDGRAYPKLLVSGFGALRDRSAFRRWDDLPSGRSNFRATFSMSTFSQRCTNEKKFARSCAIFKSIKQLSTASLQLVLRDQTSLAKSLHRIAHDGL
jgi:hypothetical protein